MLDLRFTNQFKKDYKLAQKRGYDLSEFQEIVDKLRNREPLDPKYKDHPLSNNWKNHRDFHLHPDVVVIYCIKNNNLILEMVRMGSHSDLFKK
ncbi:MAG: type II toxin-antitoxin system YafQ family toxin [Spirochaetaceae bacterium]|mgnify:CR=1 FL=1|nr:type II toxin-antitoxin system YafQ family toxin [Spirochaetaceae bacterium]MBO7163203.1 type II toxin-antitoxin system YafQ family toxin [Spirochaetaceae bacterium]